VGAFGSPSKPFARFMNKNTAQQTFSLRARHSEFQKQLHQGLEGNHCRACQASPAIVTHYILRYGSQKSSKALLRIRAKDAKTDCHNYSKWFSYNCGMVFWYVEQRQT
jgi:hypothetical protein